MQHITKRCAYSLYVELLNCNGTPMDLSSCTVTYILKKHKMDSDSTALLTYSYENPETNCLLFQFDGTETATLPTGYAISSIKIFRDSDLDQEVWTDECSIEPGVFKTT